MARRKAAADASLYAFSLFELMTGEDENTIALDNTDEIDESVVESNPLNAINEMINSCFEKGGKEYRITAVEGNTVKAIDQELFNSLNVEAIYTFDLDEIGDLIKSKVEMPPSLPDYSDNNISDSLIPEFEPTAPLPYSDYHYETSEEEYRTKGERVADNLKAIKLLKDIQSENRSASAEEQAILARYSGWGGLSDVFEDSNTNYTSVVKALTGREYKAAYESSLTAFYTPLPIIESIYKMLSDAGFKGGRILEPSCGTGKFFGMMPKEMYTSSSLYGVELDITSANIAKALYSKVQIQNTGFEKASLNNNFYDLVISNVPFGPYKVNDSAYNKLNLDIHDYFICKAVDKARCGGFVVVLTEKNTLDRKESKAREYISERAELIGAVRFPDNVFGDTHTRVVTDLLILRKKYDGEESAVNFVDSLQCTRNYTKKSLSLVLDYHQNQYFSENSENILGTETVVSGQYHDVLTIKGDLDIALLDERLNSFSLKYEEARISDEDGEQTMFLPEELEDTPNHAFVVYQGKIWYRDDATLVLHTPKNKMAEKRLRAMLPVRDELLQLYKVMKAYESTDEEVKDQQKRLEQKYDYFVQKYSFFTSRANELAFSEDEKYPLLCALEKFDADTNEYIGKADIFTERTIKIETEPKADNAYDALQISLAETGKIDFDYMAELTATDQEALKTELLENYQLFELPEGGYADAHTYLSGYVKDKLKVAKVAAEKDDRYKMNVEALEKVQPKDVPAHEIFVPLGATWVPTEIYEQFMYELFKTSKWNTRYIKLCKYADKYYISEKRHDNYRSEVTSVYGTPDINAYELLEKTMNLESARVTKKVLCDDGKERYVTDREKTIAAQQKQEELKLAFSTWLFDDPDRRDKIVRIFNDTLNNVVLKEYDGSYLRFPGMNKNIELMPHQRNAVQRIIQTGNTLLAHRVGAGKTFTMIAAAMELKRLGLCNKPMFVVPNHLISQWAGEIVRLYPLANILVTTKKDFTKKNRKKFCARIATGNYDAILCTHSQFSRIPLSQETQLRVLQEQMQEIDYLLSDYSEVGSNDPNFQQKSYTMRQLGIQRKNLEAKIESLMDSPHDDVVTFEDLGVDQIFLDEAHLFKNLAIHTKLRNVAGLTNAVSKKAQDLYGKVLYLNERTDYRGVVFATGTPISNAICELYVMQKYLEQQHLDKAGIITFDSWVSRFAETETKIEVKPEGTGYRSVIRCCKYHNLPELMNLFRLIADIKVTDLQLDLPEVRTHHIAVKPSDTQKAALESFAERAEQIRLGGVEPDVDNMLCVTNDGRKLAIDQRMYNIALENDMKSKLNRCARTVSKIWHMTQDSRATQLVFLDMGTPKSKKEQEKTEKAVFDAYNAFKATLLYLGVSEEEIAFIHDANTDTKKLMLYDNVNSGKVRILLGSTDKLGAGTNVQKRCFALHHIDCPWRPSDLDQREGRIVRPGNLNKVVHLYSYVTVNTFDTYLYQTILNKAKPIAQIMSGRTPMRDMEDLDSQCLNYAEIKALSTGNPAIKEKMELEEKVTKLKILRSAHMSTIYALEKKVTSELPFLIESYEARLETLKSDMEYLEKHPYDGDPEKFHIVLSNEDYFGADDKKSAAKVLQALIDTHKNVNQKKIGNYRGFDLFVSFSLTEEAPVMHIQSATGKFLYRMNVGTDGFGNLRRLDNLLSGIRKKIVDTESDIVTAKNDLEVARNEMNKPFAQEKEYNEAILRLAKINKELALSSVA
jgi:N12 class adenine-specific DNA methylase/adenine-specific DNA methylase